MALPRPADALMQPEVERGTVRYCIVYVECTGRYQTANGDR